ncbi:MFS transporter [Nonomuraea sp. NPDC050227]|uniref:MFS transporter n=1 Tax=Nonomuraea sp. NPDC050227 TaxID=3364360 RepID=UPI0037BD082A
MRERLGAAVELLRRNRNFRRYAVGRTASVLGTTTAPAGLAFALIDQDGGGTAIGVVATASMLVFLTVTPGAGVLADRLPRVWIIVTCQLVCGVSQCVSAALFLSGSATVWSLGGLAVLTAAAGAFFAPAAKGLIAGIVEPGALVPANALLQIAGNLVAIAGPTIAGLVIASVSPGWVLGWDGVTYLLSGAVFRMVRVPAAAVRPERRGFARELIEGLSAFAGRRWLWTLTGLQALTSACWGAGFTVLGPLYAARHLEGGAVGWGIVGSALGVGLAIGSVTALTLAPVRVGLLLCATALPEALLLAGMAAAAPTWWIAAVGALTGVAGTLQLISYTSLQQREIPQEQLSRVLATSSVAGGVLVPLFSAFAGPLADAVGVRVVLAGCAAVVVAGAAAAFSVRDVRRLRSTAGPASGRRSHPYC